MKAPNHARCQVFLLLSLLSAPLLLAQSENAASKNTGESDSNSSVGELQAEIRELKQMVLQLQEQTAASREEIQRLRIGIEAASSQKPQNQGSDLMSAQHQDSSTDQTDSALESRVSRIEDDEQLLTGKVDEQYQTKLESASKYRVRFSGIALFNLFGNSGSVNNQDVPTTATEPATNGGSGSVGGTLRQSILGFEVFGPDVWGAHSSGAVSMDFGGGFPSVYNGVTSGLFRLRTATVRLDWGNTSIVAGQDSLFFVPDSPTSYASLIVPALSYAGNLWSWTPQLRVEHRAFVSGNSSVTLQGGILDPLTGEPPDGYQYTWYRYPDAGELSRQPAYAARVAYQHAAFGRTFTLGAGGYYSRENWEYGRLVNGYAATLDWNVPLNRWFTLNGAFYRGSAIGGLGGGIGLSVLYSGPPANPYTQVQPLNTVGGWTQLKFQPTPRLEFNAAFGLENPFASDVRAFGESAESYGNPTLARNRGGFGNVIYRPRSDLLLSLEYRRLRTLSIYDYSNEASQLNLMMGILF